MLTQERLKELLHYDPETGVFTRLVNCPRGVKAGDRAGDPNGHGYLRLMVNGKRYAAHRLAWFYMFGKWPKHEIDHVNRDRTDNRIANLREADDSLNARNTGMSKRNTSGYQGVTFNKRDRRWFANIGINGRLKHLGSFDTAEEAAEVRAKAKTQYHPGCSQPV